MTEGPTSAPPSSGGVALSVPEPSAPSPAPRRRWVRWALLALAILASLVMVAFEGNALITERSMDVPIPNSDVRPGFYQNGWPARWTCSAGHDHWSLPYWMGTLALVALSALAWRAWHKRRVTTS